MPCTRIHISKEWLKEHYTTQKLSICKCAELADCSISTVRIRLIDAGITLRSYSEANKGKIFSAAHRKHISENHANMKGPNNPRYGKRLSEETKQKIGAKSALRRGPLNPMFGRKFGEDSRRKISESHADVSGAKNPRWLGGKSFEPYCEKFTKHLKEQVRDSFNRKCVVCGASENGEKLAVHHVDYSKLQGCRGQRWALVPVCRTCHSKTNHNRWQWFSLLINYWAMDQEIDFNQDLHGSLSFERCTSTPLDTAL